MSLSFNLGDFVIVRRATDKGHKLQIKWTGPAVITAVHGKLVYGVTPLTNDKEERVHSARLLPYQDQLLDTTVPEKWLEFADRITSTYEKVESIMDLKKEDENFYFHVKWDGPPDPRDWTWQEAQNLNADIPEIVQKYVNETTDKPNLRKQVKDLLKLN